MEDQALVVLQLKHDTEGHLQEKAAVASRVSADYERKKIEVLCPPEATPAKYSRQPYGFPDRVLVCTTSHHTVEYGSSVFDVAIQWA